MAVLTKDEIWKMLQDANGQQLVITPLVAGSDQVGTSSVDVHLGHEFIVFKKAKVTSVDVKDSGDFSRNVYKYQEKVRIGRGQKFVLHPHQLALAASIEYICLPSNISANIEGRSTWGRTGLVVATATKIDPGYRGCPTLELVNAGDIPMVLYPGLGVAQIVFTKTRQPAEYAGRYQCPTGPEFPKLQKEVRSLPAHGFYKPK